MRDRRRGWYSHPLTAFTRGQRQVLRAHKKGLIIGIFAEPEPPEACAGSLGEGRGRGRILLTPEPPQASAGSLDEECVRGGIPDPRAGQGGGAASPLTPVLVFFADPKPPEASARTLGEGCGRGGVPLPTRARPERGVARINRVCCWSQTAGGMHAHPRRETREGWGTPSPPCYEAVTFADLKPPEASAGSLGGVLRKGWVIPTPRASQKTVPRPHARMWSADFCGPPTAGGMRAYPR
ncbi:hypothetical protein FB107DRAFT_280746 [Schizophyllum commune]